MCRKQIIHSFGNEKTASTNPGYRPSKWRTSIRATPYVRSERPNAPDTDAILPRAVEQKVAYIPGHSFFAGGSTTNTLRLNFSNANEDHIVEGICRLGRVLRQQL